MKFELVLMLKPNLSEEQVKKNVEDVKETIKAGSGSVEKEDFWGKRKLAYEIKRMQEAYYSILDLSIDSSAQKKLFLKLNQNPSVIRYLFRKA
ncbi:30S ribosomal protein S6 [candidate division WWE3 bacterium RIFCSPHIGHO2_01_FULL_40_23]|uniref:Small ribosomal subunit protein bS6 n=1 Tax=candidate division WWE3 bacterium RIFCSPLOWO2_01_FULL_41_18 TaxID=1802625 RepID=A0A1F4VDZ6_UNCKA|nr:MAG: 30S ribosomal protein S6 [candidate division WWE3 bacterium RIFCSPHIGHO2_01_FULL_40_23]OGC55471.1 MAG: 30S ribosomal protein S6 [candidate division WWE3 bacterium RIFCSPLOWO2_01_FULL_41_18]